MTQVKERPILFSAAMVRAILAGEKTQTRRVIKGANGIPYCGERVDFGACKYGAAGEKLWVKETFGYFIDTDTIDGRRVELGRDFVYRADDENKTVHTKWTPSIHMPRKASRITLEITAVRVERLNDIGEADQAAEGAPYRSCFKCGGMKHYESGGNTYECDSPVCEKSPFEQLWESINGAGSWDLNPWVWVIEFKRV